MRTNPHYITRQFEDALCEYTGAPYAVAVTSCTMALLLATAWHLAPLGWTYVGDPRRNIEIPKRTYVGVPMSIIHAGGRPTFRDEDWQGAYRLAPLKVWDAARRFRYRMYQETTGVENAPPGKAGMVCVSFHWTKILGVQQGGAILHDDPEADSWLRRARFDGRTEGVPAAEDRITQLGWHCYLSPEVSAAALVRLATLPNYNEDLPQDGYPDLSTMEVFR